MNPVCDLSKLDSVHTNWKHFIGAAIDQGQEYRDAPWCDKLKQLSRHLGISEKALALWTLRRARELLTGRTTDESEERKLKAITELFAEHSKKTVEYTEESLRRLRKRDEPRPIDNTETAEEANKDNIPPKLPLRARPRRWSF